MERVTDLAYPETITPSNTPTITIEGDDNISMQIIRAIAEHAAQAQEFLNAITLSMETAAEEVRHETVSQHTLDEIAPTMRFRKDLQLSQPNCAICLTEFRRNKHVKQLQCNHSFCSSCISKWACEMHACCPVCRHVISAPDSASSS